MILKLPNARDGISIISCEMSSTDLIDFDTEVQNNEEEVETQETQEIRETEETEEVV